jgi:hypothetical protein
MERHIVETVRLSNFILALIAVYIEFLFWIYGSGWFFVWNQFG